jgi:hypothetical protein
MIDGLVDEEYGSIPEPSRADGLCGPTSMTLLNSAAVCRRWEAHHRQAAAEARLPNVRNIALTAAAAWARQAEEAEERESGFQAALSDEDAAIALEFQREEDFADDAEPAEPSRISDAAPETIITVNDSDK